MINSERLRLKNEQMKRGIKLFERTNKLQSYDYPEAYDLWYYLHSAGCGDQFCIAKVYQLGLLNGAAAVRSIDMQKGAAAELLWVSGEEQFH